MTVRVSAWQRPGVSASYNIAMSADPAVIRRTAENPLSVSEKDELLALNRSRLYGYSRFCANIHW